MDEDTDCGNEILCSLIAIKSAKITANELIEHISKGADYGGYKVRYWKDVINELDTIEITHNVPQVYLVAVFENENFKFKQNENRRTKLG